jgi:hypothetical protein
MRGRIIDDVVIAGTEAAACVCRRSGLDADELAARYSAAWQAGSLVPFSRGRRGTTSFAIKRMPFSAS